VTYEKSPVIIRVLDKEYRIACDEHERDGLLASARLVDQRMREIRDSGRVVGTDRIAVMAALNIAHDLYHAQRTAATGSQDMHRRISRLQEKIEGVLSEGNQLEL